MNCLKEFKEPGGFEVLTTIPVTDAQQAVLDKYKLSACSCDDAKRVIAAFIVDHEFQRAIRHRLRSLDAELFEDCMSIY